MRTLRWGSSGEDVRRLQQALADRGYRLEVDGRFGPLTRTAVQAFQSDNDLAADGIAGPATLTALGLASGQEPTGPGTGTGGTGTGGAGALALSLHIGVDRVDPAKYGGWDGALNGCENDARTMTAIAAAEGFTTSQLFTAQATTVNVLAAIADVALRLTSGGTFLLSYAGHGGQVPDRNADGEADQQDETWVLYDRQLLDDELEQAFAAFAPGVSIVMLSDSCHSGTVHRGMDAAQLQYAELKRSFYQELAVPRPGPADQGTLLSFPRPLAAVAADDGTDQRALFARAVGHDLDALALPRGAGERAASRFPGQATRHAGVGLLTRAPDRAAPAGGGGRGERGGGGSEGRADAVATRAMPLGTNTIANELQADVLDAVRAAARTRGPVRASGLLISGCLDSQLSQEVGGNGVFTTTVRKTWADNGFTGSYQAFHRAVAAQMGPTQTPALSLFGAQPEVLAARTPFDR